MALHYILVMVSMLLWKY